MDVQSMALMNYRHIFGITANKMKWANKLKRDKRTVKEILSQI